MLQGKGGEVWWSSAYVENVQWKTLIWTWGLTLLFNIQPYNSIQFPWKLKKSFYLLSWHQKAGKKKEKKNQAQFHQVSQVKKLLCHLTWSEFNCSHSTFDIHRKAP